MIKLSQTGYYALHAVIYVAQHPNNLVKIKDIAESETISESLLRRIIADLEKMSILTTSRGRNGGISLWREMALITLYDILEASWEELEIRDCTKWLHCKTREECTIKELLANVQRGFNGLLKMYTLDKFIREM